MLSDMHVPADTILTNPDGTKDGSVVQFMKDLAQDVGFTWEVHPVGNWSRARYSSSYTACVHEVALGLTDMCIGNFWMTAERMTLASFSPALYNDEFKLLVKEDKTIDYIEMIKKPALPFTGNAWFYIFLLVLYSSMAMFVIEKGEMGDQSDDGPSLADNIAKILGVDRERHRVLNFLEHGIASMVKAAYLGIVSFTSMEPRTETTNFPGRIVTLGFGSFLFIVGSVYTGATAAALVANVGGNDVESLDDVLVSGQKLCIRRAMSSSFLLRYPEFNGKLQMHDKIPPMLDDMDNGNCLAAVVMNDAWDKIIASSPEHCSGAKAKKILDFIVDSAGNGMPITDRLAQPMAFTIAAQIQAAKYFTLQKEYKAEKIGYSSCDSEAAIAAGGGKRGGGSSGGFTSMSELDMFAPFAITFAMTTVGLMVFLSCGYVGVHIEDGSRGGVDEDILIRKELVKLSRTTLTTNIHCHQSAHILIDIATGSCHMSLVCHGLDLTESAMIYSSR